jgi:hypothetical protein
VKRHQLDLFSLISGLTFVAIAVLYLLDASGQLSVNGRLVIPLLLIALGVAGLAAAVHRMARGQREAPGRTRDAEPEFQPTFAPASVPGSATGSAAGSALGSAPSGTSYRYDDLSSDLEALGLLDEPSPKQPEKSDTPERPQKPEQSEEPQQSEKPQQS